MKKLLTFIRSLFAALLIAGLILAQSAPIASAQTATLQEAKVSLTFDDGFLSTYSLAAPILATHDYAGTVYVTTGFIDSGVTDDNNLPAMNWSQVQSIKNDYGWEIGSHTVSHPELPTITKEQIAAEMVNSNDALTAHNVPVHNFASPFGAYDNNVLVEALKVYESHRGFADRDALNVFPYSKGVLQVQSVESVTTVAQVKAWIDQAKANNQWLILVFHDVATAQNPNYEYTTTTTDLTQIVDYLASSNVKVETVEEAMKKPGVNVVSNYNFADGMTNWTTSNAQTALDTNNNGAYSNAQNAVKMTGGASATHLFSGMIDTTAGASYLLETFYNTLGLTAGELGFYMDEYDANGTWISGQWLGMVANGVNSTFNRVYHATSALVKQIRVQTYLTANAVGQVFIDNYSLVNQSATPSVTPTPTVSVTPTAMPTGTVTPTPSVSVTPTVTPTVTPGANLVANNSFEEILSTFATSWERDTTDFVIDTTAKGDNGNNSLHIGANTAYAHAFSSKITIDPAKTYTWTQYVTALTGTGEFGFYMDEYDANGNWISGQWKGMGNGAFTGAKTFSYVPTSVNVKSVRLQYYVTANSTFNLYIDSVSLSSN